MRALLPSSRALVCLLLLSSIFALSSCRRRQTAPSGPTSQPASPATAIKIVRPAAPGSFVKLIERVAPAIVQIVADVPVKRGPADWFVGAAPGGLPSDDRFAQLHRSVGTGFVIDEEGHVLTSAHLVAVHAKLKARLNDGSQLALERVGIDPRSDLALLRLKGPRPKIKGLRLSPSLPETGEWLVALGRPFGTQVIAAAGIVSALPHDELPGNAHRAWRLLQTDVRVHSGNAGGPMLSMLGEVVGVATLLREETEGVGFAVPAATVRRLLPTIKRHGSVKRAHIGAYIVPHSRARAAGLGDKKGALVESVLAGGPAARAGLRARDIIVSFDGRPVERANDLWWLASLAGVDRDVKVEVLRGKGRLSFHLRTQRMPD